MTGEPGSIHDVLSGADRSLRGRSLRAITSLAEPGFALAAGARGWAYDRGWFTPTPLGAPTVSIGNLTTGGTGKTPMVQWLASRLRAVGRHPAVLMRGYGSGPGIFSDEQRVLENALGAGDWPVPVIANPDRVAGARQALERFPAVDAFVLDDGFQHRRAKRDFDLVLINAAEPFGFGHLLPRGLLREPLRALRRADAVVITRASRADGRALAEIERAIRREKDLPIFHADHLQTMARDVLTGHRHPIQELSGNKWFAFCAIADPDSFLQQLATQAGSPIGRRFYRDHHSYTILDRQKLLDEALAAGAMHLVTTEKDWVKLASLPPADGATLPILVAELQLSFAADHEQRLFALIEQAIAKPADAGAKKGHTVEG